SQDAMADSFYVPPNMTLEEIEKLVIEQTLKRTQGNKQQAAAVLGIYRPRLYSKIRKYKIQVPRETRKRAKKSAAAYAPANSPHVRRNRGSGPNNENGWPRASFTTRAITHGQSPRSVAEALGISENLIHRWKRAARALPQTDEDEIERLRQRLKMERDIL